MLDVPGSLDNHKLPNPVAVVIALNITARVKVDCTSAVWPLPGASPRDLCCESGLAGAAGPDERDHALCAEEGFERAKVGFAPDEAGEVVRQIVRGVRRMETPDSSPPVHRRIFAHKNVGERDRVDPSLGEPHPKGKQVWGKMSADVWPTALASMPGLLLVCFVRRGGTAAIPPSVRHTLAVPPSLDHTCRGNRRGGNVARCSGSLAGSSG